MCIVRLHYNKFRVSILFLTSYIYRSSNTTCVSGDLVMLFLAIPTALPLPRSLKRSFRHSPMGRHKITVDGMSACGKTRLVAALTEYATTYYHGTVKPSEPLDVHPSVITTLDIEVPELASIVLFEYTYESRFGPLAYPRTNLVLFCFALDSLDDTSVQYDIEDRVDYLISKRSPKSKGVPLILVGCRNDLRKQQEHASPSKRFSEYSEYLKQYAEKSRVAGYFECSAESGEGIPELLQAVISILFFESKESARKSRPIGRSKCIIL